MKRFGLMLLVIGGALFFIGPSLSGVGDAVDNALQSKVFAGGLLVGGALLFFGQSVDFKKRTI